MDLIHRLMRIDMALEHVLYLTYEVPATVLRPFVPASLPLATAGDCRAFLSVVLLRCSRVHAACFPLLQFAYRQINIRTYVKDPVSGKPAVYFLHSAVTSPVISVMTRIIGLPWERANLDLNVAIPEEKSGFCYEATGHHQGDIVVQASDLEPLPAAMPPFANAQAAVTFLIFPLTGFFGSKGRVRGVHIEHAVLHPQRLTLREIKLPRLIDMTLLQESNMIRPHSVLYVAEANFRIYLPARTVR